MCAAVGAPSPPGLIPLPAAPVGPGSLPAVSRGRHAAAARPFSDQGAQLAWDKRPCREKYRAFPALLTHVSPLPAASWAATFLLAGAVSPAVPWPPHWWPPLAMPLDPLHGLATHGVLQPAGVCIWMMWGALASPWQTVFLVGQASEAAVGRGVQRKGQEFGDILLGSYRDMYCNLTLKVMHDVSSAGPATSSRWMMTASTWTACPPSWLGLTWRGPASSPGRSGRSPGSPPAGDMWHGRTTVLTSTRPTPAGMGMWAYGGGARPTPHGSCLDLTTSTRMPTSSMRRW